MKAVRKIDQEFLSSMSAQAAAAPRLRAHHSLHENNEAALHRLVVTAQPGTRVRPHRHDAGKKWELLIALSGRCDVLVFDDAGTVVERMILAPKAVSAVEMASDVWHGFVAMEPDSAFMEVKPGPYAKPEASDWAAWAPEENAPEAIEFEKWCRTARVGDRYRP